MKTLTFYNKHNHIKCKVSRLKAGKIFLKNTLKHLSQNIYSGLEVDRTTACKGANAAVLWQGLSTSSFRTKGHTI